MKQESGPTQNEQIPVAAIPSTEYFESLTIFKELFGRYPDTVDHAFYIWMQNTHPEQCMVDGVSLLDLYEKNVYNGDMSEDDFANYCKNNDFPSLHFHSKEYPSQMYMEFIHFADRRAEQQNAQYEAWAQKKNIPTTPGSRVRFVEADGTITIVRTDTDHRGEVIGFGLKP